MSIRTPGVGGALPKTTRRTTGEMLALAALGVLLAGSVAELHDIAAGTGAWYADFSFKWFVALAVFTAAAGAIFIFSVVPEWRRTCAHRLVVTRHRLGDCRIVPAAVLLLALIVVLQYTPWGVVLRGPFLRLSLWAFSIGAAAWAICGEPDSVWSTKSLIAAMLLSGAAIVFGAAFTNVTSYPFSLGWSEGNRLWDYSLLFGKSLYKFDPGNEPVAYLDVGRQLIGGLPFLLPRVSIEGARFWLGLVSTVPYLIVGILAFMPWRNTRSISWTIASLFGLLFLSQGPIHPPLVICAILVLAAWRLPVWWGFALMVASGYFAESSRFTWMFAPALWAVMLELGGATIQERRVSPPVWRRALLLGTAGLVGSAIAFSGILPLNATSVGSSAIVSTSQALLWYRLLPNATYAEGILLGLLKAAGPFLLVVVLAWRRDRQRIRVQALVLGASLLAFLLVGLVVSAKIGGGGDLHNLDMFLIGLLLTAAVLWRTAGEAWLQDLHIMPMWSQVALAVSVLLPAYGALMALQPLGFASDANWLAVLRGVERPRDLGSLPDKASVDANLDQLRSAVANAAAKGPVLFMDQRQLLTFGYVGGVDLVPEYEKKRLMDEALSANAVYFAPFYEDLARHRFALIVSSPLRTPIKDSEYGFGEENNAWVQWVARPVLCYYQELDTLDEVRVELLVPREVDPTCASSLPGGKP